MASVSLQVAPGFEDAMDGSGITAGTAAPTTATNFEVRIDLVNATGGSGWTVTKLDQAWATIKAYLLAQIVAGTELIPSVEET